jgi:flagellar hook-basal body complex protein FliE
MDTETVLQQIAQCLESAQQLAEGVARGPGGRQVALAITKLEEAESWMERAKKVRDGSANS